MSWKFANPVTVIQGFGVRRELVNLLPQGRILCVTSPGMIERGTLDEVLGHCGTRDFEILTISPNPELEMLDTEADRLRRADLQLILAFGGGSVIDSAKTISVLCCAQGERLLSQWLRKNQTPELDLNLPVYVLPSTSGTGAEITPFATVWDIDEQQKRSLFGVGLYPKVALLDPEVTLSLPREETIYGAMDALSHSLETLWNRNASPVSISFAIHSIHLLTTNLPIVQNNPTDIVARSSLQESALLAGMAISQSRTALAHSISYPLTMKYGVPHGLACSFTLLTIIRIVNELGHWPAVISTAQLGGVVQLLESVDLRSRVLTYCTIDEIMACSKDMVSPSRSDNFVISVDIGLCEKVIRETFDI